MKGRSDGNREAVSARLYARLLAFYPSAFRREYGREMALVFRDRCREGGGPSALARLWREALLDLARNAAAEHLHRLSGGGRTLKTLRTVALAGLAYAFTLLVVAPLYARSVGSLPWFVGSLLDALIVTGLVFNFIFLLLTLTRWLEGVRAVRASLALTTGIIGTLIAAMAVGGGPHARVNLSIIVAQVLSLLFWFTVHLWWVLRRRAAPPPSTA